MLVSAESRRTRWLVLVATWLVCAGAILLHQAMERDYIALLDGLGRRDASGPHTPLRQVIPARYADTQMWVRHALTAEETGTARVRFTAVDNAPLGREVHWSSAFLNLLRGGAGVQRALTGEPGPRALEHTLLWFNAPLLLALLILLSAWAAVRAGAGAGVVVALGMLGHNRFYEGFAPANVDHHGVVNAAVLGLLLGLVFMGAGWWQPSGTATPAAGSALPESPVSARRAAVLSGLCGALGLWLSAAAVVPMIALAGIAGLAVAWTFGPAARRAGAVFDPSLWRLWGRVGAGVALVCYLLEYAPSHLGLRLEVNHPLYALAWWGGAEIVAQVAAWRLAPAGARGTVLRHRLLPLLGPLVAVGAVPLTILFAGSAAFRVGDPFVGELRHFVAEGRSLPAFVRQLGLRPLLFDFGAALLLVPALVVLVRSRGTAKIIVGLMVVIVGLLLVMAGFEVRWGRSVSTAQIALLLGLAAVLAGYVPPRRRVMILCAGAALLLAPALQRIVVARTENEQLRVAAGDLLQPLYRDIAGTLRASQPEGEIFLLASPNASAGIGYFGRFHSLGTLFWENAAGLRAAAEIFSAATDDEALALIRARRVTHVAMISTGNFLGEYYQLLYPRAAPAEARNSFGYRLTRKVSPPSWLQPVPYRAPPDLQTAVESVRLFKVAPSQSDVEWLYHTAIAQLAAGDRATAEHLFNTAVTRAPAAERSALCAAGGAAFYDYGADAIAVRWLQRGAAERNSAAALTLAWILATSRDAQVRDGAAALALAEAAVRRAPGDPSAWSALAAACAELGRFPDAITAAERALAALGTSDEAATTALLRARLASYRAHRPWRH